MTLTYDAKEKRILISKDIIFDKEKIEYPFLDYTTINEIFPFDNMLNNRTSEGEVSEQAPDRHHTDVDNNHTTQQHAQEIRYKYRYSLRELVLKRRR
uniref:Uncharacterized protein n=1 Tax=Physcomitrium patens TaxID=3218 RepID=A0A2K1J3L9_PHYPA|nr:hypothetical protein PHYPA_021976 [Physcomitrium patens]